MDTDASDDSCGRKPGKVVNAEVIEDSPLARQILLIDAIATRYHCLPSKILQEGDTFDVFIINSAIDIQQYEQKVAEAYREGKPKPPPRMSQDVLKAMLERARNRDGQS